MKKSEKVSQDEIILNMIAFLRATSPDNAMIVAVNGIPEAVFILLKNPAEAKYYSMNIHE